MYRVLSSDSILVIVIQGTTMTSIETNAFLIKELKTHTNCVYYYFSCRRDSTIFLKMKVIKYRDLKIVFDFIW